MGRKSKIETHPDRKIIEKRLASGEEYSTILHDFPQLTRFDLDYYSENKLPALLSKSGELIAEIESDQADSTLKEVRSLKEKAMEILGQAQSAGDLKTALLGIREARGCLELVFKAEGRIQEFVRMKIEAEVKQPVSFGERFSEEEIDKKLRTLLPYLVAEYGNLDEVIQYCRRYHQDDTLGEEVGISQ